MSGNVFVRGESARCPGTTSRPRFSADDPRRTAPAAGSAISSQPRTFPVTRIGARSPCPEEG